MLPGNFQSLASLLGLTKSEAAELLSALHGSQSNQQTAVSKTHTRSVPQMSVTSFLGCFEYTSGGHQEKESKDETQENTAGPSSVALPKAVAMRKGLSNEMTIQLCKLFFLQIIILDISTDRQSERQTVRQTDRHSDRQTDRQADRKTDTD